MEKKQRQKSILRKSKGCVAIFSRLNHSLLEGEGHLRRLRKLSQLYKAFVLRENSCWRLGMGAELQGRSFHEL